MYMYCNVLMGCDVQCILVYVHIHVHVHCICTIIAASTCTCTCTCRYNVHAHVINGYSVRLYFTYYWDVTLKFIREGTPTVWPYVYTFKIQPAQLSCLGSPVCRASAQYVVHACCGFD